MSNKTRLKYIDQAKGLGMILIILGHLISLYDPILSISSFFKIIIFYVISGYLESLNTHNDLKKRFKSLLYPYLFYSFLAFLSRCLFFGIKDKLAYGMVTGIIDTITLRGISTLWFLPTLFVAESIHFITKKNITLRNTMMVLIPAILCLVSANFTVIFQNTNLLEYFLKCLLGVFVKGLLAFWFYEMSYILINQIFKLNISIHCISLFIVGSIAYIISCNYSIDLNNLKFGLGLISYLTIALIMSFNLLAILKNVNMRLRILEFIGQNSLFIMCTHMPLYIVIIATKMVKMILPTPNSICVEYYVYCGLSLIVILLIEFIMINIWKNIKLKLNNEIIKYC